MAVSLATKTLQIFAGLGSVAIVPFASRFANKQKTTDLGSNERKITEDKTPLKEEGPAKKGNQGIMEKALEIMSGEEGSDSKGDQRGCFWMPKLSWIELFFCFNMDKLNSLFLFHYDRGAGNTLEERLNRIESITTAWPTTMNFSRGKNKRMNPRLRPSLTWMLKGPTFIPNENCRIEKQSNQKDYQLICVVSGGGAWEQNISRNTVHIPELTLQNRIKT